MPISQVGLLYSASQKKRNRELITIIINKWHIFVKHRSSFFIWCNSYDAYFTHEWLKTNWREGIKKSFGGRYLNFKEKITFLESLFSALSYDTSIRNNKVLFIWIVFYWLPAIATSRLDKRLNSVSLTISHAQRGRKSPQKLRGFGH